MIYIAPGVAG